MRKEFKCDDNAMGYASTGYVRKSIGSVSLSTSGSGLALVRLRASCREPLRDSL
jgi:hypothetical protein